MIGRVLEEQTHEMRAVNSNIEMAVASYAPSLLTRDIVVSDYPFAEARYVSATDGHVYVVFGETDDRQQIVAYRQGFWRSFVGHRGGLAVGISAEGWMASFMVLYSINYAYMRFGADSGGRQHRGRFRISDEHVPDGGELIQEIDAGRTSRQGLIDQRFRAYRVFLRSVVRRWAGWILRRKGE